MNKLICCFSVIKEINGRRDTKITVTPYCSTFRKFVEIMEQEKGII